VCACISHGKEGSLFEIGLFVDANQLQAQRVLYTVMRWDVNAQCCYSCTLRQAFMNKSVSVC